MKLYAHQKEILKDDFTKYGMFLGTGSGKTRTALLLARGKTLVICPKTQAEDQNWEREYMKMEGKAKLSELYVISKETFRRDHATLPAFDTLIVDEAHTCLGVTPNTRQLRRVTIPKASQLFDALEEFIERTKPERIYLATATIAKSPMTVWAARWILGISKDRNKIGSFLAWRDRFYTRLPMPGREVYAPKHDSKTKDLLAVYIRETGWTGRLEDYFDVPEQTFKTEYVGLTEKQKARIKKLPLEFPDPLVLIGKKHQVENGVLAGDEYNDAESLPSEKIDRILELAEEFPRMVVFVKYSEQIRMIESALKEAGHETLHLTGQTTNRGEAIAAANKMPQCIFIAQAQISAGWELPDYPVMVFASRTYSFVDYVQGIGRILRANKLKKNLYINLVVKGGVDEAVDKALVNKQDFNERIYLGI